MKNNLRELRDQFLAELERITEEVSKKLVEGKESFSPDEVKELTGLMCYVVLAAQGDEDIDDAIHVITEFGGEDE